MICAVPYGEAVLLSEDNLTYNQLTEIWGQELPTNLYQIGGLDWIGWASLCAVSSDEGFFISGVYLDKLIFYSGYFSSTSMRKSRDWAEIFSLYLMSHFDYNTNSLVLYHKEEDCMDTLSFQITDIENMKSSNYM